jgi:hypothetical protein
MGAAEVLLTGFALFAMAFCAYFAWRAGESAESAKHSEHRLAIMRGQVAGLEAAVVALDDRLKRLNGKVAADRYWNNQRDEQPQLAPVRPDGSSRDVCENWALAQREGPTSAAAQCVCDYCESMRADRAARRAKLPPKPIGRPL